MSVIATPSDLQSILEPIRLAAYDALELGIAKRDEFIANEGIHDPWFHAHVVRLFARQSLVGAAPEDAAWSIDRRVANSGMHVFIQGGGEAIAVRVLKGQLAKVPHPGHSQARQEFWTADGQGQLVLDNNVLLFDVSNALLLWDEHDGGITLAAAVPSGRWAYQGTPKIAVSATLAPRDFADEFVPQEEDEVLVTIDAVDLDVEQGKDAG